LLHTGAISMAVDSAPSLMIIAEWNRGWRDRLARLAETSS
jgi:hypothetical protein